MLPRKLTAVDPQVEPTRYKIVRADTTQDMPGLILWANVEASLCLLRSSSILGPDGLRLVALRAERGLTRRVGPGSSLREN
jgi:hypothetical protein